MDETFRKLVLCISLASVLLLSACQKCSDEKEYIYHHPTKEDFINYNRHLYWQDSTFFVIYSDSLGLNSKPVNDNLWLTIHQQSDGPLIHQGQKISFIYNILSLCGDTIYSSAIDGVKTITVGQLDDVLGVDEAMQFLHVGDSATFLLIPEKAYGVRGDGRRIHGRCSLRYDVKILK